MIRSVLFKLLRLAIAPIISISMVVTASAGAIASTSSPQWSLVMRVSSTSGGGSSSSGASCGMIQIGGCAQLTGGNNLGSGPSALKQRSTSNWCQHLGYCSGSGTNSGGQSGTSGGTQATPCNRFMCSHGTSGSSGSSTNSTPTPSGNSNPTPTNNTPTPTNNTPTPTNNTPTPPPAVQVPPGSHCVSYIPNTSTCNGTAPTNNTPTPPPAVQVPPGSHCVSYIPNTSTCNGTAPGASGGGGNGGSPPTTVCQPHYSSWGGGSFTWNSSIPLGKSDLPTIQNISEYPSTSVWVNTPIEYGVTGIYTPSSLPSPGSQTISGGSSNGCGSNSSWSDTLTVSNVQISNATLVSTKSELVNTSTGATISGTSCSTPQTATLSPTSAGFPNYSTDPQAYASFFAGKSICYLNPFSSSLDSWASSGNSASLVLTPYWSGTITYDYSINGGGNTQVTQTFSDVAGYSYSTQPVPVKYVAGVA